MEISYTVSFFNSEKDNAPKPKAHAWDELCRILSRASVRQSKGGRLFSGATFQGTRAKNNATELSLLVIEYDHAPDMATALRDWQPWRHCAYTTYSHATPDKGNCYRVVIPLAAPIPAARYPALWQWAYQRSGGLIDAACKDASRIMYLPACPSERHGLFQSVQHDGPLLDWQVLPLETTPASRPVVPDKPRGDNARYQKFCEKAQADEIRRVATAPEGTRNKALNLAANALGQLVGSDWAAGYISVVEIEKSLEAAATTAGLELPEIRRTIASGLAAGQQKPRKPPEATPRNGKAIHMPPAQDSHQSPPAQPAAMETPKPEAAPAQPAAEKTKIPPQFALKDKALYHGEPDKSGEIEHNRPVCGWLEVVAATTDIRGGNAGLLVKFKTRRGQVKEAVIEMAALFKDAGELAARLAALGLRIENGAKAKARLAEYLNDCEPAALVTVLEQTGWHKKAFVLPGEVIGDGAGVAYAGAGRGE